MFDGPQSLDVTATIEVDTPASWRDALGGAAKVAVLRLGDPAATPMPGWCTAAGQLDGPEIEIVCGGINTKLPSHAAIWRQGNLLHWGFEPDPDHLDEAGRKLFANGIAYISRFVTDRPIARVRSFVDPAGGGPSMLWLDILLAKGEAKDLGEMFAAPWQAQITALDDAAAQEFVRTRLGSLGTSGSKFAFDDDALALAVDMQDRTTLQRLVDMLDGEHRDRARTLLERWVADGPAPGTTRNNWHSWLSVHGPALCFDRGSRVFREDLLAHWRNLDTTAVRGPARADGGVNPAEAVALAAKIVAHHGGRRALDDLHALSFRIGEVRFLWDRRNAILRIENSTVIPPGNRATPWKVVIFDTAADVDILEGGGPPPVPRFSGRSLFRDCVEALLLPLLLLEPGTSLRLLADDEAGDKVLGVRLGMRCMDPNRELFLHVRADGTIDAIDPGNATAATSRIGAVRATTQVGPLQLCTTFETTGRRRRTTVFEDLAWNPEIPDGLATAATKLFTKE
ncbi:MAG: hypothetical protein U1E73_03715 [Planctomycetota bacterium]